MLKLKSLILFASLTLAPLHHTANAASNPAMVPIISYLLSDSSFSFGDFTKGIKYFVNENSSIGYRDYIDSNTYDGVVNDVGVSGSYTYDENSMTLTRDDGTILVFTNPRPTVFGNGITFDLSVNASPTFETYNYDTEEERDAAYVQVMSYSYEELASNEYYGVNEDGSFNFVVTYADLGNNDRNLTVNSFDQANQQEQTFTIDQNVITLNTGATNTRIAIYVDYSQILYDHDGDGDGTGYEPVLRRSYSDRAKAEAFYDSVTVSFVNDVMPIFDNNCKSCHNTETNNRTFQVDDDSFTHDNITTNMGLINTGDPDSSSILIKGNGGESHKGGDKLSDVNSTIVRDWIEEGGMNN